MIKFLLITIIISILLKVFNFTEMSFWKTEGCVLLTAIIGYISLLIIAFFIRDDDKKAKRFCPKCKKATETENCKDCGSKTTQFIDKGDYIELSPAIGNLQMVAKEKSPEGLTLQEAGDYAKSLRIGGFDDWRVPPIEDLKTMYEIKDFCGITDKDIFWASPISYYVGQTTADGVDFSTEYNPDRFPEGSLGYKAIKKFTPGEFAAKQAQDLPINSKNFVRCARGTFPPEKHESLIDAVERTKVKDIWAAFNAFNAKKEEKNKSEQTSSDSIKTRTESESKNETLASFCPKCEKEIETKFCKNCGSKAIQFIDKGDYIELSPAIGNIRMIEKVCSPNEMNWNDAMQYAKNWRKGSFNDWRVPTTDELKEIYKIKDICGINKNDGCFWSSSVPSDNPNIAWHVDFRYGSVDYYNKTSNYNVRCVR